MNAILKAQDNPDSSSSLAAPQYTPTIAVNAAFLAIAWVSVLLRVYTRVKVVKVFHWEDALIIFSAVR